VVLINLIFVGPWRAVCRVALPAAPQLLVAGRCFNHFLRDISISYCFYIYDVSRSVLKAITAGFRLSMPSASIKKAREELKLYLQVATAFSIYSDRSTVSAETALTSSFFGKFFPLLIDVDSLKTNPAITPPPHSRMEWVINDR